MRVIGHALGVVAGAHGDHAAVLFHSLSCASLLQAPRSYPAAGYSSFDAFLMESVLTLGLVSVILGTASGAQSIGVFGAIGVGAYIALAGLWGSPISGASMNPAEPSARTSSERTSRITGSTWQAHSSARCSPSVRRSSFGGREVAEPDPVQLREPCGRRSRPPRRHDPHHPLPGGPSDPTGTRGPREGSPREGPSFEPCGLGSALGSPRPGRSARRAGDVARPRAGADPLRQDARVAVRVLSRCGRPHGRGPRRHAALGAQGPVLR